MQALVRDRPALLATGFGLLSGIAVVPEMMLLDLFMRFDPHDGEGRLLILTLIAIGSFALTILVATVGYGLRSQPNGGGQLVARRTVFLGVIGAAFGWAVGLFIVLLIIVRVHFWFLPS